MKLVKTSGTERGNMLQGKLISLKQSVRTKVRHLCKGINDFKNGYQPRT
jgi:hypothetical protein